MGSPKLQKLNDGGIGGLAHTHTTSHTSTANHRRSDGGSNLPMPKPQPLPEKETSPNYPVQALGPILGEAACALAYHVQAPLGLAAQSVLAAAALVAQGYIDVERGRIGRGPVSLFCLSVAESGDRKSSVDKLALKPIRDFEAARREHLKEDLLQYKSSMTAWELRRESVIKSAKPKSDKVLMTEADEARLAQELASLEAEKPTPPPRSPITFSEPTPEAIWRHYQQGLPSAGLFSDEGVQFFNGHGMTNEARGRMIGCISQLWDGSTLQRTRAAEGESGELDNRRLSTHLMVQPVVSSEVLSDPLLLGQGFLARFLVCHEDSLAGSRFLQGRDSNLGPMEDPAINKYWQRLNELLNAPPHIDEETGGLILQAYPISGAAYEKWAVLHDGIEAQLSPDSGRFGDIKGFASKAAENAARIAAVLAFIEGSTITPDIIQRAGTLIAYYLESMAIRTGDASHDKDDIEARDLLTQINRLGGSLEASSFKSLPRQFRSAKHTRQLLKRLTEDRHLLVTNIGPAGKPSEWEIPKC